MMNNKQKEYDIYSEGTVSKYLVSVFVKMGLGLLITFAISVIVGVIFPQIAIKILSNSILCIGLIVAELAVVFFMYRKSKKLEVKGVNILYYVFTILNGLMLSYIYLIFNSKEIFTAFCSTGLLFGTLAAYGHYTKKNLSHWRNILYGSLIALTVASLGQLIAGAFWGYNSIILSLIISSATIVVMSLYVAYDIQSIRKIYFSVSGNKAAEEVVTTLGAFNLYINFISIFQHILRIISITRKND